LVVVLVYEGFVKSGEFPKSPPVPAGFNGCVKSFDAPNKLDTFLFYVVETYFFCSASYFF